MRKVVVLGSANMDLVVRQPRLPRPGETLFGSAFRTVPGGKGLNQAVAAARAGAEVAFVGAVGRDVHGAELRRMLEAERIDASALQVVDAPTGTAHIAVVDGGENSIVVVSGANAELTSLTEAARAAIDHASALVMQFELPQSVLLEAARAARARGARTVLTPAPAQQPEPGLLELVDVLVPNADEARHLADEPDVERAAAALSRRCGTVVVTLGAAGALVAQYGRLAARIDAVPADAVDTTGAGDTFVGVLVARLTAGDRLEAALGWAATAASISVTRPGATTSMPTRAEIEAALAR